MGRSEEGKAAKQRYDSEYIKKNTKQFSVRFNIKTDKDILDEIEKHKSFVGYIKDLIRRDIKKG